ncbi:MAG: phosphoribosylformylglycinamidine cyclo-ligase [Planctomycetes bacterium]|nr:phosphoribosylformylglycinamidine cyclo-ligase [Planctomycetota bacterium]
MAITYKDAGVDIDRKAAAIERASHVIATTHNAGVLTGIGHFGGLFALRLEGCREPVAVSSTDGVGTKVEVASAVGDFTTIGEDIVNHCVNDILCCGARPLFFLDYIGTSRLVPEHFEQVIRGLARACRAHDCPLVGGETAEMPGVYHEGRIDLVGTIVGVAERAQILDGSRIRPGDALLGLASNGLHTNGYTLARKVLLGRHSVSDTVHPLTEPLGRELLRVHRSYFDLVFPLLGCPAIAGLAHVTGGGIVDNVERLLPPGLRLEVDWSSWERPALFSLIQQLGPVPEADMRHAFNLGIGFVLILHPDGLEDIRARLTAAGETPQIIGRIAG